MLTRTGLGVSITIRHRCDDVDVGVGRVLNLDTNHYTHASRVRDSSCTVVFVSIAILLHDVTAVPNPRFC